MYGYRSRVRVVGTAARHVELALDLTRPYASNACETVMPLTLGARYSLRRFLPAVSAVRFAPRPAFSPPYRRSLSGP